MSVWNMFTVDGDKSLTIWLVLDKQSYADIIELYNKLPFRLGFSSLAVHVLPTFSSINIDRPFVLIQNRIYFVQIVDFAM